MKSKFNLDYEFHQTNFQVVKTSQNYVIGEYNFNKFYIPMMDHKYIVGQTLRIDGVVQELKPTNNSYDFDFNKYLQNQNVFKAIKIKNIVSIEDNNLKYLINKFIYNNIHNELILKLVFQKNTELHEAKGELQKMSLAYLLNFSGINMYVFSFVINRIFFKFKINPQFKIPIHLCLILYLWMIDFPLVTTRIIFGYIILNLFVITKISPHKTARNVLTLLSLVLVQPNFFSSNALPFLVVVMLFLNPIQNHIGWRKTIIQIIKPLLIFIPIQIFMDWRWNFTAPIQTIIIQPVISFLYLFSFLFWWIPNIEVVFTFLTNSFNSLVELLSKINLIWNFGQPPFLMLVAYYLAFYLWSKHMKMKTCWFIWIVVTLLFLFWTKIFLSNETLTMLNIGNGSSFVYINKWKNLVLIFDAGTGPGFNKSSMSDYLMKIGINHVDIAFISHNHDDHYNSLEAIQSNLNVHEVIKNNTEQNYIEIKGVKIWLWHLNKMEDENDNSLVILVKAIEKNFLFVGDLTKKGEGEMLKNPTFTYLIQNTFIDLFQLGHHGSKTSSSEEFLLLVNPRMTWISAGLKNNHHFPDQVTIDKLNEFKLPYKITGKNNNWTFNLSKDTFYNWQ
ncbi:ComEC/Rec2 family competence protein [Williamsoniiplasma luminosum]|uniref:ComEC/Rec2 family competence protein n=1 Tax=Williamsoniiplasma luminosum TaxID=214888 RepID=UPI0012EBB30C|nr:MBL fold metallo-hydrolase [Williamsoniiplasma luminosum]